MKCGSSRTRKKKSAHPLASLETWGDIEADPEVGVVACKFLSAYRTIRFVGSTPPLLYPLAVSRVGAKYTDPWLDVCRQGSRIWLSFKLHCPGVISQSDPTSIVFAFHASGCYDVAHSGKKSVSFFLLLPSFLLSERHPAHWIWHISCNCDCDCDCDRDG